MERLLEEATKLSGVEYSIGNFSDIIDAIHVVQTEMGITGTTAKEATETISGSLAMTKSAWSNLLTGMADETANFDQLFGQLMDSAGTFADNIMPRIEIVIENIGKALPTVIEKLLQATVNVLPSLLESGIKMIEALINGIILSIPQLMESGMVIIQQLITSIATMLPSILQAGIDILVSLISGIASMLPELVPLVIEVILTLYDTLLNNYDKIIDAGISLLISLADGIINALPMLLEKLPFIITKIMETLARNIPRLIETAVKIVAQLAVGLVQNIPQIISAVSQLMWGTIEAFGTYYSELFNVGKNLVSGIWEGITGSFSWLMSKIGGFANSVTDGVKSFFGIHSPSRLFRDEVGNMLAQGIGVGFEEEIPDVNNDIQRSLTSDFSVNANAVTNSSNGLMAEMIGYLKVIANKETNIDIDGRTVKRILAPYQEEDTIYNSRNASLSY